MPPDAILIQALAQGGPFYVQEIWQWLVENAVLLATAGSAFFTFLLYLTAKKHFTHERTSGFIERYNEPAFVELRARVDHFLHVTERLEPCHRGLVYRDLYLSLHAEDMRLRHELWTFAMLFNEIGYAWSDSYIEHSVIQNFDRLIPRYMERLRPYIVNLHLNYGFKVPPETVGCIPRPKKKYPSVWRSRLRRLLGTGKPTDEDKEILFKGFYHAYRKLQHSECDIRPKDLQHLELDSPRNHLPLKEILPLWRATVKCRPPKVKEGVMKRLVDDTPDTWDDEFASWLAEQKCSPPKPGPQTNGSPPSEPSPE